METSKSTNETDKDWLLEEKKIGDGGQNEIKILNGELKYLRHILNLTQQEMSEILNVSRSIITKSEKKNFEVTENIIRKYDDLINYLLIGDIHLRQLQIIALKEISNNLKSYIPPINYDLIKKNIKSY